MLQIRVGVASPERDGACILDMRGSDPAGFERLCSLFVPMAGADSDEALLRVVTFCHERLSRTMQEATAALRVLWVDMEPALRAAFASLVPLGDVRVSVDALAGLSLMAGRSQQDGWFLVPFYVSRDRQRRIIVHELLHFLHDDWRAGRSAGAPSAEWEWFVGEAFVAITLGLPEFEEITGRADEHCYTMTNSTLASLRAEARSWPARKRSLPTIHAFVEARSPEFGVGPGFAEAARQ